MAGWVMLAGAIISEVVGTLSLKAADGFRRPGFIVLVVIAYGASFSLLALALRTIQVGPAYAIWSGVGAAIVTVAGVLLFREHLNWLTVGGIALIVLGVVVLTMFADVTMH